MRFVVAVLGFGALWASGSALRSFDACRDATLDVADFDDQITFDTGLTKLQATMGHSGPYQFARFERIVQPGRSGVLRVVPLAGSGVYFVISERDRCFEPAPQGYRYTTIEFDAQLPAAGASMEIVIQGDPFGSCNGARSASLKRWTYTAKDAESHRVNIVVNADTDLAAGASSILFTSFTAVGATYLFDNLSLHRSCDLLKQQEIAIESLSKTASSAGRPGAMLLAAAAAAGTLALAAILARRRRIRALRDSLHLDSLFEQKTTSGWRAPTAHA